MSARLSPDYTRGGSGMRGDSYRPGAGELLKSDQALTMRSLTLRTSIASDRSASPYSSRHPDRDAYDRYERERDPLDLSRGDRYPAVDEYGRSRDRYAGGEDRYGPSRHDRHDRHEDHDYYHDRAQEADREREYERTGRRGGGRGEDQGPIPDPLDAPSVLPFKQFAQVHRKRQARLDPSAPTSNLTTQQMFDLYKRYKLVYGARSARRFWEEKKEVAFFKEKYSVAEADVERRKERRRIGRMGKKRVWLQELRDGQLDNASAQMHFASSKAPPGDEEASMNTVWSRNGEPIKVGADNSLPVDPSPQQLLIMRIPPNLPRRAIEEELKNNCPGFLYLAIGEAHANKQYFAIAWANFDSAENAEAARAKMVDNPIFTDNRLQLDVAARGAMVKFRTAPSGSGSLRRLAKDLKQARDVVRWVEREDTQLLWPEGGDLDDEEKAAIFTPASAEITKRVFEDLGLRRYFETGGDSAEDEDEVLLQLHDGVQRFDTSEEADLIRVSIEKTLDLHLDLLREVYFCDYYSSTICDFPEELDRRARGHFRRVYPNGEMEPEREGRDNGEDGSNLGLEQWADNLDRKNALLVGNTSIDIEEHGGVDLDKLCLELATPFTRQDDREKHRCIVDVPNPAAEGTTKTCDKLFKALIFVQKHVCNKHRGLIEQELGEGRREDILYLNNYVRDPTRVMPPLQSNAENGRGGGGRRQDMGGLMRMGTISSHDGPYDYDAGPRRRRGDSRRRSQSPPPRNGRLSERFNGGGLSDRLGAMPNNNPPPIHLGGDRPLMFSSSTDPTSAGPPLHLRIGGQMMPSLASFGPLTTPVSALGSAGSPAAIEPLPPAPRPLDPRAARGQTRSYQDLDTGSGGKEEEVMDLEY